MNDAARYVWLRDWLVRTGLLNYMQCQPDAHTKVGAYWVLRTPAVINGSPCEGFGTTADAAIDAALAAAQIEDKP